MSNNASNNYVGISMDFSSNSMIIGNSVLNNSRWGIRLAYPINNTLLNNIAKFNNEEGIFVGDGFENTISNNICESNECGIGLIDIYIDGCDDIDIFASNNTITNNTCKNNSYGIGLTGCFNNTISSNLCESNEGGISLGDAINNTLYHNNFINNTYGNAYDPCTNQWDSGSEGNYWSDYREKYPGAVEIDDSGIWDTPYDIPGGTSTDRFPLMHPWTGDTPQKGDLNHDNHITPADAAIALRLAASGAHDDAADVSDDGCVTSLDAFMILQAAAERIKL